MQSSTDVIVLSSSPACAPSHTPYQIEHNHEKRFGLSPQFSSPASLVSPSELFKPAMTSRFFKDLSTRTKNKSPTAAAGKSDKFPLGEMENVPEDRPKGRTKKPAKKTETGPGNGNTAGKTTRKTAKAKNSGVTKTNVHGVSSDKNSAGKVAKTGNKPDQESGKNTDVMPSSPAFKFGGNTDEDSHHVKDDEGLQLEEAMRRRLDWTPPKDTITAETIELQSEKECSPKHLHRHDFENMLSGYNFSGNISSSRDSNRTAEGDNPTKRRRIELVSNGIFPVSKTDSEKHKTCAEGKSSTKRPKKQQPKRITTITAHAMAEYISNGMEKSATSNKNASTIDDLTTEGAANSRLQRRTKRNSTDYTVLSPEDAVKSVQDQDLIFGTCSQLERDDSPTTLEETQLAIRASEKSVSKELKSHASRSTAPASSSSSAVSRFTGTRNLWCVAARDSDGTTVQAEMVDLVDSPDISKVASAEDDSEVQDSWPEIEDQPEPVSTVITGEGFSGSKDNTIETKNTPATVDQTSSTAGQHEKPPRYQSSDPCAPQVPPMPQYSGFTDSELSKTIAAYGFKSIKGRKKMIDLLQKCWESKYGKTTDAAISTSKSQDDPPDTSRIPESGSHLVEEKKAAQEHHSAKTSSSKDSNIFYRQESLDQVANREPQSESNDRKSQETTDRIPTASTQTMAPRRNYTRRKGSTPQPSPPARPISFQGVEEIIDSEDEDIPSPSRLLQNVYTNNNIVNNIATQKNNPLPISTIPSTPSPKASKPNKSQKKPALHPPLTSASDLPSSRSERLPDLASQITRAVYAQPLLPLSSNKRLTWHEKILMYDPIVLEDFATWLNTEGLGLIEEDREVSAGFLRGWCEGRGICCCWKKGDGW